MNTFATHTTLLSLIVTLLLLPGSRAPVADESTQTSDETKDTPAPALTDVLDALEAAAAGENAEVAEPVPDSQAGSAAAPEPADAGAARPVISEAGPPADAPTPAAKDAGDDEGHGAALPAALAIDTLDPLANEPANEPAGEPAAEPSDGEAVAGPAGGPLEETPAAPLADRVTVADEITARTLTLLSTDVPPGSYQRLSWSATEMFEDLPVATPVLVVNGKSPGPTLCLTAAVHGDELNGIEMVRRVMHDLNPKTLSGAVIGVPIVNLQGFRRGSRYLPDRRDLNRYFPGNPRGSAASRIAHSFFTRVIEHCDALVDLHTGSFDRANLPQLRADLRNPDVVTLTHGFGATVILHSEPADGTLRFAATSAGIPTVTLEAGGPSELELKEVMHGVKGIETLLNTLGMVDKVRLWGGQQPVYYRSSWVRANRGGILLADVSLGSTVRRGDLLGTITDPMNNASTNLYSPYSGRVIGMARNQVVMPGFAAFHVGIQAVNVDASAVETDAGDDDDRPQEEQEDETLAREEAEDDHGDYVDGMSE